MATITQKISSQTCHFTRSILHIRRAACSPSRVQTDLYAFPQVINTRHKVSSTRMEKRREEKKSWKKKKILARKMIPNFVFCTPSNLKKILFEKFVTNYENVQRIPSASMQLSLFVRNKRGSRPNKSCLRGVEALSALQFLLGFVDCT